MATGFSVDISEQNGTPVVKVSGEIDLHTCPELSKVLQGVLERNTLSVVLNLEEVSYIDSTGLGVIAFAARQLSTRDGKIFTVCTQPHIRKVFELSGLHKKNIVLYDNELSAIKGS